jgi:hypothetical protein
MANTYAQMISRRCRRLTGLEFHLERVFYKYIAPTALGFASKFTPWKIRAGHRQEFLLASDITINRSFSRRNSWLFRRESAGATLSLLPAAPYQARNICRKKQKGFSSSVRSGIFGSWPTRTRK